MSQFQIGDKVVLKEIATNNHLAIYYGEVFTLGTVGASKLTFKIYTEDGIYVNNWYYWRFEKVSSISLIETSPEYEGLFE